MVHRPATPAPTLHQLHHLEQTASRMSGTRQGSIATRVTPAHLIPTPAELPGACHRVRWSWPPTPRRPWGELGRASARDWEDLSLVVAWRQFMRDPQGFFRHLFEA